jgi:hypothetical protein
MIHRLAIIALFLLALATPAAAQIDVPPPQPQRPRVVERTALQSVYWYESWPGSPCSTLPPLSVERGTLASAFPEPFDEGRRCRWTWTVQGAARTVTWNGAVLEQRIAFPLVRN